MSKNNKLVGENFQAPDLRPKVTGEAKYADDFLFDNALHTKLVKSPYAHARVKNIDTSAAEAMSGVEAIVTHEDAPDRTIGQPAMDKEPKVFGYPVAAVAARDNYTAAAACEEINVEYEVLPHVIDPVETLKPGGPNARSEGNAPTGEAGGESAEGQGGGGSAIGTIKWKNADFSTRFPENPGQFTLKWSWGNVQKGLKKADIVVHDTIETQGLATNPMEPRSTAAHWGKNGKLKVWGSSQSITLTHLGLAEYLGIDPMNMTFISNYTGGGFGSKGTWYPQMAVPALLSKKVNKPVKIRGTRREEFHWGNGRTREVFEFKIGFTKDGRMTALNVSAIGDAGAYSAAALSGVSASVDSLSSMFSPETMKVRCVGVFTNTPKRWPFRGPGENQAAMAITQVLDKAAEKLNMDPLELRQINAPKQGSPVGAKRNPLSSAYLDDALKMAGNAADYQTARKRSGTVKDGKAYGVGVGVADHASGYVGFDGLVLIHTDGTVEIRQGAGNLGTESYAAVCRAAAETLDVPWDQVEVSWGSSDDSSFTQGQFSSNTMFTEGLANVKAAETAVQYLKEIAAAMHGDSAKNYRVADGTVKHSTDDHTITLAEAARYAVNQLGGKYTAEKIPQFYKKNLGPTTIPAAKDAIGTAIVAFGKTTSDDIKGVVRSFNASVAEVAVDVATGKVEVEHFSNYGDSGTIVHPDSYTAQIEGGTVQGFGFAVTERYNHDNDTGVPLNPDFYKNKPPSILDYSKTQLEVGGVDKPDPYGPHGAKGVGEPPYGAAAAAVASAVQDALGTTFMQFPLSPNTILEKIESGETRVK
jgi:xanthine dehydrogenase molybdenum-binding subunit